MSDREVVLAVRTGNIIDEVNREAEDCEICTERIPRPTPESNREF